MPVTGMVVVSKREGSKGVVAGAGGEGRRMLAEYGGGKGVRYGVVSKIFFGMQRRPPRFILFPYTALVRSLIPPPVSGDPNQEPKS